MRNNTQQLPNGVTRRNAILFIRSAAADISDMDINHLKEILVNRCMEYGYCHIGTLMSIGGRNHGIGYFRKAINEGDFDDIDVILAIAPRSEKNDSAFIEAQRLLKRKKIDIPIVVVREV